MQNATTMFGNMDVVVDYVNSRSSELGYTLEYGTLRDYFQAIRDPRPHSSSSHHGGASGWVEARHTDFMPYALEPATPPVDTTSAPAPQHQVRNTDAGAVPGTASTLPEQNWWSGEFTSWPLMKKMTRIGAAKLRAAEQLAALTMLRQTPANFTANMRLIEPLRRASAEAQHHDAVDGTSTAPLYPRYSPCATTFSVLWGSFSSQVCSSMNTS